jgi:hypothetical protein
VAPVSKCKGTKVDLSSVEKLNPRLVASGTIEDVKGETIAARGKDPTLE